MSVLCWNNCMTLKHALFTYISPIENMPVSWGSRIPTTTPLSPPPSGSSHLHSTTSSYRQNIQQSSPQQCEQQSKSCLFTHHSISSLSQGPQKYHSGRYHCYVPELSLQHTLHKTATNNQNFGFGGANVPSDR